MPQWLEIVSIVSLLAGFVSSLIIEIDILAGHKQNTWVMNIVWPITALYSAPLGLLAYYKLGHLSTKQHAHEAKEQSEQPPGKRKPFGQSVAIGATHCGSGCTLGDILAFLFGMAFQYFTIKPMRNLSVDWLPR